MSRQRQELCRNFQRGSCRYGAQCKFLHAPAQQSKQNPFGGSSNRGFPQSFSGNQQQSLNPFGFGSRSTSQSTPTNQQSSNPFGFGVSTGTQSRNTPNSSNRYQGQPKPFQNTWTRNSASATSKSEAPQQVPVHNSCTDPEACKLQIVDDFNNEMPSWKLTCYGHRKGGPCDITGDISVEELRAAAYDDARQGKSLQSIVDRERNLLNAKLAEFDNLFRNPYVPRTSSFMSTKINSEPINASPFGSSQPPVFSSFSQLGAVASAGNTFSAMTPGQPNVLNQTSIQKGGDGTGGGQMTFGVSSGPGVSSVKEAVAFGNIRNTAAPSFQSAHSSSIIDSSNGFRSSGSTGSVSAPPLFGEIKSQSLDLLHRPAVPVNFNQQQSSAEDKGRENKDDSIWMKESWTIGEIPEDEPPSIYCH